MSTARTSTPHHDEHKAHHSDKKRRKHISQNHALISWVGAQTEHSPAVDALMNNRKSKRRKGFPKIGKAGLKDHQDLFADTLPVGILGANIQTEFMNFRLAKSMPIAPVTPHFWSPSGNRDTSIGGWMSAFKREKYMFTSADIFSKIKFSEALEIVSCAARPTHLLSVTIVQILREMEAQLGNSRNLVALALVDCLLSTFVNYGQDLTSSLAYDLFQNPVSGGRRGMSVLPDDFETGLTYFEHIRFLEKQKNQEISLLPQFKANLRRQKHLTNLQIRIINQTVENWTKSFAQVAFDNFVWCWRQRKKLRRFITLAFRLKTIGKKQVMSMWKAYVKERRLAKQNVVQADMAKRLRRKTRLLEETRKYIDKVSLELQDTNEKLASFEAQVAEKENLLQRPERQPFALGAVTVTLCQAIQKTTTYLDNMLTEQADEIDEYGELEPVCNTCLNSFTKHIEDHSRSATSKILEFVPGKNETMQEGHPSFKPFSNHAGLVLRDWIGTQVTDTPKAPLTPKHFADGNLYSELLREVLDPSQQQGQRLVPPLMATTNMKPQERVEDAIVMAKADKPGPTAKFMRPVDVTGIESALSPKELKEEEALKRKLENLSGGRDVVCHVITTYFGKRLVVPAKVSERKQFAWLGHLFVEHPNHKSDRWLEVVVEGVRKSLTELKKLMKDMQEMSSKFSAKALPSTQGSDFLTSITDTLGAREAALKKALVKYNGLVLDPSQLQREWKEYHHELLLVAWQAMSTKVLSRRSVTEVDVDDGTYTKLHAKALKDIFDKLRLTPEAVDECIASMTATLKEKIRLTKRTYQYYAAAGSKGALDSMDRYEFWKFIKESKVQADRKLLPSPDVDMIFDRILKNKIINTESNMITKEIGAPAFIHGLVRLAFKRYKHTKEVNIRLQKLYEKEIDGRTAVASVDVFRDRMNEDDVKVILDQHHEVLKAMFDKYACADQTGEAVLCLDTMNKKELIEWGTDFDLLGATLSQRNMNTVFAYCQQSDDMDVLDSDDTEMVYSEFLEALIAVSCWIIPDPYLTMGMRVRRFIERHLLPKFKTGSRAGSR